MKKITLFSLFAFICILTFSCKKSSQHVIEYSIQGTAGATVTYTDQSGNTQTVTNAGASWTTSFSSSDWGLVLKLTAVSTDGSNVGGKIFIDGKQAAQSNGNSNSISISSIVP
jgi:hypothetical protein